MKKLLFALLIAFAVSSCASYKRCARKFATTTQTDSVKVLVPVSVTVPKDSVIYSFVTDTVTFQKEVQQGRARLTIKRTPQTTSVQATCDTVTITKTQVVKVPGARVIWGVAPWYRKASLALAGVLVASVLINLILLHNNKSLKRKNELHQTRNQLS